jgi:hypothetical protein
MIFAANGTMQDDARSRNDGLGLVATGVAAHRLRELMWNAQTVICPARHISNAAMRAHPLSADERTNGPRRGAPKAVVICG